MSNFKEGDKVAVVIKSQKYIRQWDCKGKPMYTYKVQNQDGKWYYMNKREQKDIPIGDTFDAKVSRVSEYDGEVQVYLTKVDDNGFGGKGKSSGYVAFEPRQQASINASTAIAQAVNLAIAGKITLDLIPKYADTYFDYIQGKVLAIDPNAYKMPVAASSTNESTNTQSSVQSSNSVAANSQKQEPAYTAVSDDDDLPF